MEDTASSRQRMAALERANMIRTANHRLRAEIRRMPKGEARAVVAQHITSPAGTVGAMPVERLLGAIPGVGVHKARQMLGLASVYSLGKRVDALTERQGALLAEILLAPTGMTPRDAMRRITDQEHAA